MELNPCDRCSKFDLEHVFATVTEKKEKRILPYDLGHPPTDSCQLCVFQKNTRSYSSGVSKTQFGPMGLDCRRNVVGLYTLADEGELVAAVTPLPNHAVDDGLIYGRRVEANIVDFELFRGWISQCRREHTCGDHQEKLNLCHFRLIDCTTRRIVPVDPGEEPEYVTLSYVWGTGPGPRRVESLVEWLSENELPVAVPKVVTDAMTVVRELGFRYLWVDRYCIPQINQGLEVDKTYEDLFHVQESHISKMGRIYASSAFTIIAAAGDSCEIGLAGITRVKERYPQPSIKLGDRFLVGVTRPTSDVLCSVWDRRGWTFQEGALSRRRLVFLPTEVYFQCQEMQCLESLSAPVPFDHSIVTGPVFPPYRHDDQGHLLSGRDAEEWEDADTRLKEIFEYLDKYVPRGFTFPSDVRHAFRGITETFRSLQPPLYLLMGLPIISPIPKGYWHLESSQRPRKRRRRKKASKTAEEIDELVLALTWSYQQYPDIISIGMTTPLTRRESFPSWTWMGWSGYSGQDHLHLFNDKLNYSGNEFGLRKFFVHSAKVWFGPQGDGKPLPWDTKWRGICNKTETEKVDKLEITGWYLDVSPLVIVDIASRNSSTASESDDDTQNVYFSFNRQDDILSKFGAETNGVLPCLLIACSNVQGGYKWFGLLLLKKLPDLELYERDDFIYLKSEFEFEEAGENEANIGSLLLTRKTIFVK
ncbi:hypothetical protein NUW58_g2683 [Xylaria curta]|uniref:Uncharacterized protein n=1 Tax=Xylaria curta TaxID=42375 RepID=A0ACC1PEF6_9PEZI|nr:hypothetical protein NUW58_g2683 [Xylaria curta]